jgi:NCAIR mutase (PurE)-related protein
MTSDPAARRGSGPNATTGAANLGYARLDLDRSERTGDPEVVYAPGKSIGQLLTILGTLRSEHPARAVLATRCDPEALAACEELFGAAARTDPVARTVVVGDLPAPRGIVAVLCAGTSDLPVAHEAAVSVAVHGSSVDLVADVGVAGLHRLLGQRDRIARADAVIAVAGMEGALPSVVAGLVGSPVIAVPTSVGYGASFGGVAALLAMLNSCAPGVSVVNIDNGYGAGVIAARIARATASSAATASSEGGRSV